MKAEDTVMNNATKRQFRHPLRRPSEDHSHWDIEELLKAQAEISFKAGIKEVVEWVQANAIRIVGIPEEDWQAKLKEWGIKGE